MTFLETLAACAGQWQGSNRLYDPNNQDRPDDTPSTLDVRHTPALVR